MNIHYRLAGPSTRLRFRLYTVSGRRMREDSVENPDWGKVVTLSVEPRGDLGEPLANGTYHFLAEAFDGEKVADSKGGSFFILR